MNMRRARMPLVRWGCLLGLLVLVCPGGGVARAQAQAIEDAPTFQGVTVERQLHGFSIDLLRTLSERLGWRHELTIAPSFWGMLERVAGDEADLAVGNLSITSAREARFDYTHPVFDAGLQILVPTNSDGGSVFAAIFTWEMAAWVATAVGVIFVIGRLIWLPERRHPEYFSGPSREGMWPGFWYTLQAMINGGFEQPVPRSVPARVLGILLVLCSLFVGSAFGAKISSTMTVNALRSDIQGYDDLYGERVGTTRGSTAAEFLTVQAVEHTAFDDTATLFEAVLKGKLDVVVHDAPVLRYFAATAGCKRIAVAGPAFKPEKYRMLLAQGSERLESLNRAVLHVREDGTYSALYRRWFGNHRTDD